MEIQIDIFDKKSIDGAVSELIKIRNSLDKKMQILCERLVNIGLPVANMWFDIGVHEGKQETGVSVEVIPTQKGCKLKAYGSNAYKGEVVFFIEFGTGVYAHTNEMNTEGLDTTPGSWSKDHIRMFTELGWWQYTPTGFLGEGTEPYSPMNKARLEILKNIQEEAKKVFIDD